MAEDVKPGWKTVEAWSVLAGLFVQAAVAFGWLSASKAESVTASLTQAIVAVGVIVSTAVMVWKLIHERTALKLTAMKMSYAQNGGDHPEEGPASAPGNALLPVLLAFLLTGSASAQPPDFSLACVRVPTHGVSATVIYTGPGATYLIGCGHGYEPSRGRDMRHLPMSVDVPWSVQPKTAKISLVAVDYRADLSLVRIDDGPWPYRCAVPGIAYRPGRLVSAGYDYMGGLRTVQARLCTTAVRFAEAPPQPGASGGGLIDENGALVGVYHGFECRPGGRPVPNGRGFYADVETIRSFLVRNGWQAGSAPANPAHRQSPVYGQPPGGC